MSNTPRNVTRNQLAEFLPNQRLVRTMEQLLKQVNELLPADIVTINRLIQEAYIEAASGTAKAQAALDLLGPISQDAAISAGAADAKATAALDALNSIARSLDLLAKAPQAREDNSVSTDYIDFNVNPKYSMKPGRVHWGKTGTLEIEMGGGNITQQVGEEFFAYGKATAAITDGQLVMVTGALGASGVITFAPTTTGILDPNAVLGIATENIALNGFGRVTTMGVVRGIDTTGASVGEVWADGDVLWYNTAVVGGMTKVKPVAPNMKTQVAIVINAGSGGSGSLQVEVIHGSTLGGTDTNVQLSALADKQLLQYNSILGHWKNVAVSSVGSTAAETHAAASKATPVDVDEIPLADSAASWILKKLTWANLKAAVWNLVQLTGAATNTDGAWFAKTTSGNASARNFSLGQTSVFGQYELRISNALGGDPIAAGSNLWTASATFFGSPKPIRSGVTGTAGVFQIARASDGLAASTLTMNGNTLEIGNDAGDVVLFRGSVERIRATATGATIAGSVTTTGGATFHATSTALTNGAGAAAGTLLNAPVAGNPTKWIGINDNGTTRYIPTW